MQIVDPDVKDKTKCLVDIAKSEFGQGKYFLNRAHKALKMKKNIAKLDHIKLDHEWELSVLFTDLFYKP